MFFFFTCGTHTFQSVLKGYENVTVQCQNCGNHSGHVYKRWEWFTFCFIPIIPFSIKPDHDVGCGVCNFFQDLKFRPEITNGQAQGAPIPMQGWNGGGPPPPPPQNQTPQYK